MGRGGAIRVGEERKRRKNSLRMRRGQMPLESYINMAERWEELVRKGAGPGNQGLCQSLQGAWVSSCRTRFLGVGSGDHQFQNPLWEKDVFI